MSFKATMGSIRLLMPALTITHDEMAQARDALDQALGAVMARMSRRP